MAAWTSACGATFKSEGMDNAEVLWLPLIWLILTQLEAWNIWCSTPITSISIIEAACYCSHHTFKNVYRFIGYLCTNIAIYLKVAQSCHITPFSGALNEAKKQNHSLIERVQQMQNELADSEVRRSEVEGQIRQSHIVSTESLLNSVVTWTIIEETGLVMISISFCFQSTVKDCSNLGCR